MRRKNAKDLVEASNTLPFWSNQVFDMRGKRALLPKGLNIDVDIDGDIYGDKSCAHVRDIGSGIQRLFLKGSYATKCLNY